MTESQEPQIESLSESDIICRAKEGDKKAFDKLVCLYQQKIYYTALKILKNPEDAMDATQEAFINAYRHIGDFEGTAQFSSWLHRIAVNVCLGRLRKNEIPIDDAASQLLQNHTNEDGDFVAYDNSPSPLIEDLDGEPAREFFRIELTEIIKSAVAQLSPDYQHIVIMRCVEEMSHQEIASVLEINEGAAKTRMLRARRLLKKLFGGYLND